MINVLPLIRDYLIDQEFSNGRVIKIESERVQR